MSADFAMLSGGALVVKLPQDRVDALIAAGIGAPYDAGKGEPMRQWVAVPAERSDRWPGLAAEALKFVRG